MTRTAKLALLASALTLLAFFSIYLCLERIIQVDEAQWAMQARLMGTGKHALTLTEPIWLLGPLSWLAKLAGDAATVFSSFRLVFVGIFWINIALTAKAAGARLRTPEGLAILLLAATVAPLWDYGFEIRHDNLLLMTILGLWLLVRPSETRVRYWPFWAGILAALSQFLAFKAFLYVLPLLAAGFWWVRSDWRSAARPALYLGLGLLVGVGAAILVHAMAGNLSAVSSNTTSLVAITSTVTRFPPWLALSRALQEAPLLAMGGLAVLVTPLIRLHSRGMHSLLETLDQQPEWLLLCVCFGVLLANPTPYPYNLVLLIPMALIAVLRLGSSAIDAMKASGLLWLALPILLGTHLWTWWAATERHLNHTNARQQTLMNLTERLTDPALHHVFDGSGLVPTRDPVSRTWLLHGFTVQAFHEGFEPLRLQLARVETPVILTSYRTKWLPESDWAFIRSHYRPLGIDIAVLGFEREVGNFSYEALAEGRYMLAFENASATALILLNGKAQPTGPIVLKRGLHAFEASGAEKIRLTWLGPTVNAEPNLPPARHELFLNWY